MSHSIDTTFELELELGSRAGAGAQFLIDFDEH